MTAEGQQDTKLLRLSRDLGFSGALVRTQTEVFGVALNPSDNGNISVSLFASRGLEAWGWDPESNSYLKMNQGRNPRNVGKYPFALARNEIGATKLGDSDVEFLNCGGAHVHIRVTSEPASLSMFAGVNIYRLVKMYATWKP